MFRLTHALRNQPIKRKLLIISMLTTGVALLVTCVALVNYELFGFTQSAATDLETTAAIAGDNISAALVFRDTESATQTLNSLQKHPQIVGAAVYDKEGNVFSVYRRPNLIEKFEPPPLDPKNAGVRFGSVDVFHRIELTGETVGWIFIRSTLDQMRVRINNMLIISALVILGAFGIGLWLLSKLQVTISGPISHLSAAAQRVATERDYSIRAVKYGDDELGQLIDGFNEMLNQIQQRDSALQEASNTLEKRVEERTTELAHSIALLNATLESTADGILAIHFDEGSSRDNSQYRSMWKLPPHIAQRDASDPERMQWLAAQTTDPKSYLEYIKNVRVRPELETFDTIELKDGRTFERYVKPQRVDGKILGIVVNFRDISARKRAEKELEAVHQQLLESSRQAGMAEVATGVLHNVGNVLNSVNVSANLIGESARHSKVSSLGKLVTLLEQHKEDLAAYITTDPNGRHLPEFLTQLSQRLQEEQQTTIAEVETLRSNIDHIKQIVAMQQTYSKASGFKEVANVAELVHSALRINEIALQRHGVGVVREIESVPDINTEKHKILQILVNLIRNAKFSCQESGRADKCITIRTAASEDRIRISVIDNGVGIAPENLTRIFNHGFTTRKDGHGFGLHSGALAARELGGALHAHSEGLGRGASFTLELPLRETELAYE